MKVWEPKDPDEIAFRYIDWSQHPSWHQGDSITSATFTLSTTAGMTIADSDHDYAKLSRVTLSGGTAGSVGKILCQAVTYDGQTLQQTMTLLIRAR